MSATAEAVAPSPARVPSARARQVRRRLLVVALVLAAAFGLLIDKVLTSAVVYFKTAQEALRARATLGNATFQLEGVVVPGSIVRQRGARLRFVVASGPARVRVEERGTPPQLFQANIPVVLVGHFVGSSDLFASDQILVKHSNVYIAAHPGRVRAPDGSVR
ncbi:MAG TPA: cytochrome c maturation protein CcmE [Acidimicrobiales bacterium]|nr:cytochrome c maturation protein CcmE [Acidimicrobiales bacterium]